MREQSFVDPRRVGLYGNQSAEQIPPNTDGSWRKSVGSFVRRKIILERNNLTELCELTSSLYFFYY